MVYLYVDIRYYPQLVRVDQGYIEGLLASIDQALSSANGRAISPLPPLLYAFDDSAAGATIQVSQAAFAAWECVKAASDRLSGYSIMLERMEEASADEASRVFKAMRFPPETTDAFIVGPNARPSFSEYFMISYARTSGEVSDFTFSRPLSSDESQSFWERKSLIDAILKAVDPILSGDARDRILVLPFKRDAAAARCVERAIRPFAGPFPVPLIRPRPEAQNPFAPIVAALSRADAAVASSRLSLPEQAAFTAARSAFELISASPRQRHFPAEVLRRLSSYVELFLAGLSRDRRARGHEAFLILEDSDRVHPPCLQLIARALSDLQGDASPIVLVTCEDESASAFGAASAIALPDGIESAMAAEAAAYASSLDTGSGRRADAAELAAEHGQKPLALYHALLTGRTSRNPTRAFLSEQPAELLEILYVSHLASGVLERRLLDDFFAESGIKPQTQGMAFHQLFRMGLVLSEESREPSVYETMADIEIILGDRAREARSRFAAFMEAKAMKGIMRHALPSGKIPAASPMVAAAEALGQALGLSMASDDKTASEFLRAVRALPPSSPLAPEGTCLEAWASFERAFLRRSPHEAAASISAFSTSHEDAACAFRGQRLLCRGFSSLSSGSERETLSWAKEALIAFQSSGGRGEARANRLLGLHSLRQGLFLDAMDYLSNAYLAASKSGDDLEALLASYYEGITYYLYGNLSRALRLSYRAIAHAGPAFRTDWEVQASLLAARVESDLGRPQAALDDLEACLAVLRLSPWEPAERRVHAWMGRMMARAGMPDGARKILERLGADPEAALFRAEAFLKAGDPDRALAESGDALRSMPPPPPFFPDSPGFTAGTELVEDCLSVPVEGSRASRIAALAVEAKSLAALGRKSDAADRLHTATHDPGLHESDPALHEYLYGYFLALPDDFSGFPRNERLSDRGTVLSRAFKYLQLRASRIDTAEDKNDFMLANPLNRELSETARTFKFT